MKWWISGAVAVGSIAWLGCDAALCRHEQHSAVVVERVYTPTSTRTGVGPVVGGDGKSGVVVTTSTDPEKWTVICQTDHETLAVETTAERWAAAKSGERARLQYALGKWTGWRWNVELLGYEKTAP